MNPPTHGFHLGDHVYTIGSRCRGSVEALCATLDGQEDARGAFMSDVQHQIDKGCASFSIAVTASGVIHLLSLTPFLQIPSKADLQQSFLPHWRQFASLQSV